MEQQGKTENNGNSRLETGNIWKLMLSLSIPSIIAQLVGILYNMVDRMFIGRIENGTTAMAALSVSLPLITCITAFTRLVGIGGAPLCAIKMGKKDQRGAEEILGVSFAALITVGVILTVVILVFQRPILTLFGADPTTLDMACDYVSIYALGTVFVMISLGMNSYITTQGFARTGMCTVLIGAILNIIFDAFFINYLHMGVKGAAIATIIAQGISCIWALSFLFGKKSLFQISFNNQLSKYGGTMAVGTVAIMFSLWQFVTLPTQGFCQGAQPIISYNSGAGNLARVRKACKISHVLCLVFATTLTGLMMIFPGPFAGIFSNDPSLLHFSAWALPIYLAGGAIFWAQISCQQSFMSLGQAKISLILACLRKVILLAPLIYIFPVTVGKLPFAAAMAEEIAGLVEYPAEVFSIFFAEPVSDILAAVCTSATFYVFYKRHLKD